MPIIKSEANDITRTKEKVQFDYRLCKRCKICKAVCPKGAIAEDEEGEPYLLHPELCNQCGLCELYCPDFAVTVEEKKDEVSS